MQPLVICSFCISFRKRLGCACEVLVPNLCHSPHRLENFLLGRDVEIVHSFGISHSAWSGPTGPCYFRFFFVITFVVRILT